MTRPQYVTPAERIAELVAEHGSYRKAAKAIGCSHPYLHRVYYGKAHAGDGLLAKLGLRVVKNHLRTGA